MYNQVFLAISLENHLWQYCGFSAAHMVVLSVLFLCTHTQSPTRITLFIISIEKSRDALGFSPERFLKLRSRRHWTAWSSLSYPFFQLDKCSLWLPEVPFNSSMVLWNTAMQCLHIRYSYSAPKIIIDCENVEKRGLKLVRKERWRGRQQYLLSDGHQ